MIRFLFACLMLVSSPVIAKDDGGFGSARFTAEAPVALGGQAPENQFVVLEQNPADIEPAAGDEEKTKQPITKQSNHQVEPYTIQKDLEIR